MTWSPYLACLWPGGASLWHKGELWGLAWAVPFAAVLNFCLIFTSVWPELVEPGWVNAAWFAAWTIWLVGAAISAWRMPSYLPGEPDRTADQLLVAAQEEYLRGNWFEAEATLVALLQASPEDAEARLLLATLLRRTHKLAAARAELEELCRLDAAAKWQMEIDRELTAIAELEEEEAAPGEGEAAAVPMPSPEEPTSSAPPLRRAA